MRYINSGNNDQGIQDNLSKSRGGSHSTGDGQLPIRLKEKGSRDNREHDCLDQLKTRQMAKVRSKPQKIIFLKNSIERSCLNASKLAKIAKLEEGEN
jgi:hypothetical protein